MNKNILLAGLVFLLFNHLHAGYYPTPLTMPVDSVMHFKLDKEQRYGFKIFLEEGSASGGFDGSENHCSLGALYSPYESILTMLRSPQAEVLKNLSGINPQLLVAPDLGGRRGAVDLSGHIYHQQVTLAGAYNLNFISFVPGHIDVHLYMPFVNKEFDGIGIKQQATESYFPVDIELNKIGQNLSASLQQYGGLSVDQWKGSGIGDPVLLFQWGTLERFADNDMQTLSPRLYVGLSFPCGAEKNEDELFSLPLGYDGHWAIPFGSNLEFTFRSPIKIGFGVDVLYQFPSSRTRRIKTNVTQTNLLLLNKASVLLSPGLTWRLNWFMEGVNLWKGFSIKGGYEGIHHYNDSVSTHDENVSEDIINTAATLQNWYGHILSASIKFDPSKLFTNTASTTYPFIEGFIRFPVSGKRLVNTSNILGLQLAIHF